MEAFNLAEFCLAQNAFEQPEATGLVFIRGDLSRLEYSFEQIEERCLRLGAALHRSAERGPTPKTAREAIERARQNKANRSDNSSRNPTNALPDLDSPERQAERDEVRAQPGGEVAISAGPRVLIRLRHGPDFAFAFLGAIARGFVPVALSPQLTATEVLQIARDSGARFAIAEDPEVLPLPDFAAEGLPDCATLPLAELERSGADLADSDLRYAACDQIDPAFLIYTSGTGGSPRGVLHAHRVILGRLPMLEGWTGIRPGDRVLHAGQLNWTYSLGVGLMDPWSQGAASILFEGRGDPTIWPELIRTSRATIFAAVPSLYRRILKYADLSPESLGELRHGLCAGEALSPALLEAWREATLLPLFEALGMSEISTYVSSGPATPVVPGSPGRPQPGRRVAILSEDPQAGNDPLPIGKPGLLAVHRSDPGLMLRYWSEAAQNEAQAAGVFRGEWFCGGDVAELDGEGYLWFHGRRDEILNAQGYRVSPREIEAALESHPGIAELAATELQVRDDLRILALFAVRNDAGRAQDEASLRSELEALAAERLAEYKRPREIRFLDALPRTANGKLRRKALG